MLNVIAIWSYRAFYPQSEIQDVLRVPRSIIGDLSDGLLQYADNHLPILVFTNKWRKDTMLICLHDDYALLYDPLLITGVNFDGASAPCLASYVANVEIPELVRTHLASFHVLIETTEQYNHRL